MPFGLGFFASAGASAAAGSFEFIETITATGTSGTITFSNIPQTYKHLQIRGVMRSSYTLGNQDYVDLRCNGVSSTVYAMHSLNGTGSAVGSTNSNTQAQIRFAEMNPTSASAANIFSPFIIDITDYASTSKNKTIRALRGLNATDSRIHLTSGLYGETTAISSLSFITQRDNFVSGSRFSLYGIRG